MEGNTAVVVDTFTADNLTHSILWETVIVSLGEEVWSASLDTGWIFWVVNGSAVVFRNSSERLLFWSAFGNDAANHSYDPLAPAYFAEGTFSYGGSAMSPTGDGDDRVPVLPMGG